MATVAARSTVGRLRTATGLVLAFFVTVHLINHSLGLISLEAMDAMREVVHDFWSQPLALWLLYLSLLTHLLLALWSLYRRQNLKLARWEAAQLGLGLLIVPLVAIHIIGTRGAAQLFAIEPSYARVVAILWLSPERLLQQIIALLFVWGHLAVGLHFWLRLKPLYPKLVPVLYPIAVLLPLLALLGFLRAGLSVDMLMTADPNWLDETFQPIRDLTSAQYEFLVSREHWAIGIFLALLATTLLAREARRLIRRRFGSYRLTHANGRTLRAHRGTTVLEAMRAAAIPHASVCGGRGRCTTCRVRIDAGLETLDPPNETERAALEKINAPKSVRLACQTRPTSDLQVTPLLPATATARAARRTGGVEGREQQVAIMFIDLRGSTALAERMLPFDVVYVLNHFFAEMSLALEASGGHYAQFNGDGLMALYGLDGDLNSACRRALSGAADMLRRVDELNREERTEIVDPLRVGIGIHCGEAIVGRMGPPQSPIISAIGDNVNVAARLEALTKTFGCCIVVSEATARRSGLDLTHYPREKALLKGRQEPIAVLTLTDMEPLAGQLTRSSELI